MQAIEDSRDDITKQKIKDFGAGFAFLCVIWDAEIPQELQGILAIGRLFQKLTFARHYGMLTLLYKLPSSDCLHKGIARLSI